MPGSHSAKEPRAKRRRGHSPPSKHAHLPSEANKNDKHPSEDANASVRPPEAESGIRRSRRQSLAMSSDAVLAWRLQQEEIWHIRKQTVAQQKAAARKERMEREMESAKNSESHQTTPNNKAVKDPENGGSGVKRSNANTSGTSAISEAGEHGRQQAKQHSEAAIVRMAKALQMIENLPLPAEELLAGGKNLSSRNLLRIHQVDGEVLLDGVPWGDRQDNDIVFTLTLMNQADCFSSTSSVDEERFEVLMNSVFVAHLDTQIERVTKAIAGHIGLSHGRIKISVNSLRAPPSSRLQSILDNQWKDSDQTLQFSIHVQKKIE